jgi:methylated-DNA-[protein]-cysteine S-methyltransferase
MDDLISEPYSYRDMDSPVGRLRLIASDTGLVAVLWNAEDLTRIKLRRLKEDPTNTLLIETEQQLNDYFDKKRTQFDLPLDLIGTDFQKKVWEALLNIPFGKTKSYGDLAKQLGDLKAVRAVGGALNKNPVSIIVPCHRVIGASGDLTGFAGGLSNKNYLLKLEDPNTQFSLWN